MHQKLFDEFQAVTSLLFKKNEKSSLSFIIHERAAKIKGFAEKKARKS
jgi:hypothetical protein